MTQITEAYKSLKEIKRIKRLKNIEVDYIVTSCPNCLYVLGKIRKVYDIIEFLNKFLI